MANKSRGRNKFSKFKPIILAFSKMFKLLPLFMRIKLFEFFRMTKGTKGIAIRYMLLKSIAIKCGDNVSVLTGVYLLEPDNLIIGNNVSIHPMCYIDATGKIIIKDDVSIAHGSTIMSTSHNFKDKSISFKDQGLTLKPTTINNDVWVGAKSTILSGVTVGSGSVIAAGAVVSKDVAEYSVVAGVPAKVISYRQSL